MLHLIYCNLPCKIIDQSEFLESTCLFSGRYVKIKHMQITVQILDSQAVQIYIVMMSTPTLPNSTKNPTVLKSTPKSSKSTRTEQAAGPNTSTLKPTPSSPKSAAPPTPTSLKSTTTEPAAGPNTSAKATPLALPSPIPELTWSSPMPLQSQTRGFNKSRLPAVYRRLSSL